MFAITIIEGNNRSILGKYETLQKAREAGERVYRESAGRMSVSLIEADFDGNDQIIGQKYKLYHMWAKTDSHENSGNDLQTAGSLGAQPEGKTDDS